MTRKDYVLITGALNQAFKNADTQDKYGVIGAALALADALATDNARFNRGLFFEAVYAS